MRRQNLQVQGSFEVPNYFDVSSIQLNHEQHDLPNPKTKQNIQAPNPKSKYFKQFEQNSINGLEGSLSMSANKDKILELLRSKSHEQFKHSTQKDAKVGKEQEQLNPQGISLYNTSSFDDMTMRMTIRNNISNLSALSARDKKVLKKPEQMKKFKATYGDSDMKIVLSKEKGIHDKEKSRQQPNTIMLQVEEGESAEERAARQQKVDAFVQKQNLLASLQCSNVESEPSRNFQSVDESGSYQEPYFNKYQSKKSNPYILEQVQSSLKSRRPEIKVQTVQKREQVQAKAQPSSAKKLTLRDYINLNHLKSEANKQKQVFSPFAVKKNSSRDVNSPQLSSRSTTSGTRRKAAASNRQVFDNIKQEICKDISLVKANMERLLAYLENQVDTGEPTQAQILEVYSVQQVIKETILIGNDRVIKSLKDSSVYSKQSYADLEQ